MATSERPRAYLAQLQPYGDKSEGWQWLEIHPGGGASECRTDPQGEGRWVRGDDGWSQARGHMQFYLPEKRQAAAAKLLTELRRRWACGWLPEDEQVEVIYDDGMQIFTVVAESRDSDGWYQIGTGDPIAAHSTEEALAQAVAQDGQHAPVRIRVWVGLHVNISNAPAAEHLDEGTWSVAHGRA